jgi:hypothetical protein
LRFQPRLDAGCQRPPSLPNPKRNLKAHPLPPEDSNSSSLIKFEHLSDLWSFRVITMMPAVPSGPIETACHGRVTSSARCAPWLVGCKSPPGLEKGAFLPNVRRIVSESFISDPPRWARQSREGLRRVRWRTLAISASGAILPFSCPSLPSPWQVVSAAASASARIVAPKTPKYPGGQWQLEPSRFLRESWMPEINWETLQFSISSFHSLPLHHRSCLASLSPHPTINKEEWHRQNHQFSDQEHCKCYDPSRQ